MPTEDVRHLIFILGDQLDLESAALNGFDTVQDVVFMAEVTSESTRVWSHVARTALFLSAMRHFAGALREKGLRCDYAHLGTQAHDTLSTALADAVSRHRPRKVVMVEPVEWGIEQDLARLCAALDVPLEAREDTHFLRVSSARFLAGASSCVACTGSTCRACARPTISNIVAVFPRGIGPARRGCGACRPQSDRRCNTAMRITSSG